MSLQRAPSLYLYSSAWVLFLGGEELVINIQVVPTVRGYCSGPGGEGFWDQLRQPQTSCSRLPSRISPNGKYEKMGNLTAWGTKGGCKHRLHKPRKPASSSGVCSLHGTCRQSGEGLQLSVSPGRLGFSAWGLAKESERTRRQDLHSLASGYCRIQARAARRSSGHERCWSADSRLVLVAAIRVKRVWHWLQKVGSREGAWGAGESLQPCQAS